MNDIALTFGIPLYNCEKYICELLGCFDFNNNFKFEVIIVNDGSTDNSLNIVKKFHNSKLKIINKPNGGVSSARNKIIEEANGKWITFIDADDLIDFNKYLLCFKEYSIHDSDLIICLQNYKDYNYIVNNSKEIRPYIIKKGILNSPCMKFYKTEILKKYNLWFDNNISLGEDALFNIMYLSKSENIKFFFEKIYSIRKVNNSSLSSKYRKNKIEELIYVNNKSLLFCKNKSEIKSLHYVKMQNCRGCLNDIYIFKEQFNSYSKRIQYIKKIKRIAYDDLKNSCFSLLNHNHFIFTLLPSFGILFIAKTKNILRGV